MPSTNTELIIITGVSSHHKPLIMSLWAQILKSVYPGDDYVRKCTDERDFSTAVPAKREAP